MGRYFYKLRKEKDALAHPKLNISKKTNEILEKYSKKLNMPVSRLIAIAIDNELTQSDNPFEFEIILPYFDKEKDTDKYFKFASKIHDYLAQWFQRGASIDTLVLCRRDIGIESKQDMLNGLAELMSTSLVEEVETNNPNYSFNRKYIRLTKDALKHYETNGKAMKKIDSKKAPL